MRRCGWQRAVAVLLSVLMVGATSGVSLGETAAALPYSGQTVFRGVFLGDGPVAKLFPEIWESTGIAAYMQRAAQEKSPEAIAAGKQQIIDILQKQDPTFFARFGAEMQSGDRIRIQQALAEAGTRLKQELKNQVGAAPAVRPPENIVVVYLYIAVAVVAAVALAIAEVIAIPDTTGTMSSSLQSDVYVDLIAQRLQPAQ